MITDIGRMLRTLTVVYAAVLYAPPVWLLDTYCKFCTKCKFYNAICAYSLQTLLVLLHC